uniref:Protein TIFY 4B isoform X3 n=1 Tax=Rhizophora mucronata TaxID=61149 RepID=A0A2P2IRN0_RHIMU
MIPQGQPSWIPTLMRLIIMPSLPEVQLQCMDPLGN